MGFGAGSYEPSASQERLNELNAEELEAQQASRAATARRQQRTIASNMQGKYSTMASSTLGRGVPMSVVLNS